MKKITRLLAATAIALSLSLSAEITEIDGVKYECKDGICMPVEESGFNALFPGVAGGVTEASPEAVETPPAAPAANVAAPRFAFGYMKASEFLAFLRGETRTADPAGASSLAGKSWWLVLILVFLGGLAMNLTPCVLPMMPINLMVIGKSASRGALYGLGIALAYGTMGLLAAVGGMAFGEIQSNPYFNAAISALFLVLALALLGAFYIDFSGRRGGFAAKRGAMLPGLFAFAMGAVSAVLAGACVAPILIAVLLLTADLSAQGHVLALGLPFVLGLGMALPWPLAGAGMQVLPKPGGWMKWVNKLFGVVVLGFAAWYGYLAYEGFRPVKAEPASLLESGGGYLATPATFDACFAEAQKAGRPIFVDCWATWCKNCAAMEKTTLVDEKVRRALKEFTVIRLQAENLKELKAKPDFADVKGLPAFAVYEVR